MNKRIMQAVGLGDHVAKVEQGLCLFCNEPIDQAAFRDELSRREFRISGLCQKCQDDTFGTPADA